MESGDKDLLRLISLSGRKAVVTGAASGIGKEVARILARAGASLVLADVDERGLDSTREELRPSCAEIQSFKVDLSEKREVNMFWRQVGDRDLPDILVNNAGVYPFKDYLEIEEEFLREVLDVNFSSAFWMSQGFIKRRESRGGVIVNVSSIEAILPFKEDMASYSASKAAVIALTRSLARDYGKKGFRINAIVPGAIRTPGTQRLMRLAIRKLDIRLLKEGYNFQQRIPLGRWGRPEEVARVVLFLCSDLSSYVNGAVIPVDGGFLSA